MTKVKILDEVNQHFNEVIISITEIGRLIGFHEDEYDYYYRIRFPNGSKRREVLCSCVGGFTPLHGYIPQNRYVELDNVLQWNGCPKENNVIITGDYEL